MTIEILSGDECRELLGTLDVGRLGVIVGGYPEILPVNYALVRDRIVVRTAPGTKLSHAKFDRVSFEVDSLNHPEHTGWSVLVKGVAHELNEDEDLFVEAEAARIKPWAPGEKRHLVVVTPISVTGRRIRRE